MSKENDDFVENLLGGLSKAEPISEFELRKFEKMIDRQASEYKRSSNSTRFKYPASIAASIAIVFGAVFVLTNQSSVTGPTTSVTESGSTTESGDSNSSGEEIIPAPVQSNSSGSAQGTASESGVFGNSDSSGNQAGSVPVFNSNLDYGTELNRISKVVVLPSAPGDTASLQNKAQQCAIKLGVSKSLLAIDSGYFQDQRVQAYYSGKNKSDYQITLVDSDCTIVAEL
jgi:hypothetical protein